MALQKIPREEVIDRLLGVFRQYGYEGASLTMISEAVGLQKASLYHLFPEGKEAMARAVLESVGGFLEEQVLTPLRAHGTPEARLARMMEQVREFYGDGRFSCLFETLSLGGQNNPFSDMIGRALNSWQEAMAGLARERGASKDRRSERPIIGRQFQPA